MVLQEDLCLQFAANFRMSPKSVIAQHWADSGSGPLSDIRLRSRVDRLTNILMVASLWRNVFGLIPFARVKIC